MQTTIGQRIRQKRKEFKWTQQELAKKLKDVSHVAISQWESNTTKPNAENLYELSLLLRCDFGWLLKGEGESPEIIPIVDLETNKIPVIYSEQLENWDSTCPLTSDEGEYIMTDMNISELTFALKIVDDSMKPEFLDGDIVIIDPEQKPKPGEFVVAKIGQEIFFRKYQIESYLDGEVENFSITPLNTDFPAFSSVRQKIQLLGVMVEHRIYRRKR